MVRQQRRALPARRHVGAARRRESRPARALREHRSHDLGRCFGTRALSAAGVSVRRADGRSGSARLAHALHPVGGLARHVLLHRGRPPPVEALARLSGRPALTVLSRGPYHADSLDPFPSSGALRALRPAPSQRVIVLGATGLVGRTVVALLEERRFPVAELRLLATEA